ncbi:MAG: hypothetical protein FIA92_14495 [Chloroflexi bacterium]|nr:hypothetical protein [Chloroflexota bacterium]
MAAVVFRLGLLAAGMGAVEIGLGDALVRGSLVGWALVVLVGLPLIVAGSAGFMVPLLGGPNQKGTTDA